MKLFPLILLGASCAPLAEGAILLDTVVSDPFSPPMTWSLSVDDPNGNGAGLSGLILLSGVLVATDWTIGIEHNWFAVSFGDAFTANYANSTIPFATNTGGPAREVIDFISESAGQGGEFYLGFELAESYYGWVGLRVESDQLVVTRSILEDSGRGLIVGTPIVIPEPSSAMLIFAGSALCLSRRKRS